MILRRPFVFLIGDDGALLVPPGKGAAPLFMDAQDFKSADKARTALLRAPQTPLLFLADNLAQSFQSSDLPRLGFFDRRKLLRRRLAQAFPDAPMKEARALGKTKALLMALHENPALEKARSFLADTPNPKAGTCLLPLESARLFLKICPAAAKGWGLFLTLDAVGGCRQIVTQDGALIFTRLTPLPQMGASPAFIAASLNGNIAASRAYLARFGLEAETEMTTVAILPPDLHEAFAATQPQGATLCVISPRSAAARLKRGPLPDDDEIFSDFLHAAFLQKTAAAALPLFSAREINENRAHGLRVAGKAALAAFWLLLIALTCLNTASLLSNFHQKQNLIAETRALQQDLKQSRGASGGLSEPLGRLRAALAHDRLFAHQPPAFNALLEKLATLFPSEAQPLALHWQDKAGTEALKLALRLKPPQDALLQDPADDPRLQTEALLDKMCAAFPSMKIEVASWPEARTDSATAKDDPALLSATFLLSQKAAP